MTPSSGPSLALRQRLPKLAWESHKETIRDLYIVQNKPLKEVVKFMKEVKGFEASQVQYERKLRIWGYRKNATEEQWKYVRRRLDTKHKSDGKLHVYMNGVLVPDEKVRKHVKKCFVSTIESLAHTQRSRTPEGVDIIPDSYMDFMQSDQLPWIHFCNQMDKQAKLRIKIYIPDTMRVVMVPRLIPNDDIENSVVMGRIFHHLSATLPIDTDEEIMEQLHFLIGPTSQKSTWEFLKLVVYLLSNHLLGFHTRILCDEIFKWFQLRKNHLFLQELLCRETPTIEAFAEEIFKSAITAEDISMIKLFLRFGINPNLDLHYYPDRWPGRHITPLEFAIHEQNMILFQILLDFGADINYAYPLGSAIRIANYNMVEALLDNNAEINPCVQSPLADAIEKQNIRIINLLLHRGANVNPLSKGYARTPLESAAMVDDINMVSYLLGHRANLDVRSMHGGDSALHWAVRNGNIDMTLLLLNNGEGKNHSNWAGVDVIVTAVLKSNYKLVEILLSNGFDVMDDGEGPTALEVAVQYNDVKMVRLLLEANVDPTKDVSLSWAIEQQNFELFSMLLVAGARINNRTLHKCDALCRAVSSGNIGLTKAVLGLGADPNHDFVVPFYHTALQIATLSLNRDIIDLLVESGADCNYSVSKINERNALQIAAGNGDLRLVQYYISVGGDINCPAQGLGGRTTLQSAVENGATEVIEFLIREGANVNAPPAIPHGITALQAATQRNDIELVKTLLDAGANICGDSEFNGFTALYWAADNGNNNLIRMLLYTGANINAMSDRYTPLSVAARNGNFQTVKFLLDNGALPRGLPSKLIGNPALLGAARGGYLRIAKLLLDAGADVNEYSVTNYGTKTALGVATMYGRIDMIRLLLQAGAKLSVDENKEFKGATSKVWRHHAAEKILRCHQIM